MRIGLFADNHDSGLESEIAQEFQDNSVDVIISLGDNVDKKLCAESIIRIMEPFCETGLPFYAITGNHEKYDAWSEASKTLTERYPNYVDAAQNRIQKLNGLNLIFVPGTERVQGEFHVSNACHSGLHTNNGNNFYVTNLKELKREIQAQALDMRRTILFCHDPPEQEYENGTDSLMGVENPLKEISDELPYKQLGTEEDKVMYICEMLQKQGSIFMNFFVRTLGIKFVFSGHIHKAVNAITKDGKDVTEGEYASSLFLNPAPAKNGAIAIIDVKTNNEIIHAKYARIFLYGREYNGFYMV